MKVIGSTPTRESHKTQTVRYKAKYVELNGPIRLSYKIIVLDRVFRNFIPTPNICQG